MSMIFQDPFASLHPFYRIGAQLVEAVRVHRKMSKADARTEVIDMLARVGIPNPERGSTTTRTSCPAACASA